MAFDAHKNLAIAAVATAPSPAPSGVSLTVGAGEGARFPVAPFNATVWPATALPTPVNAEVVRVTALAGDTFTITRAQEQTTARAILPGDLIAATITAKTITDVEAALIPLDNAGVWVDVPYNPANYKTVAGATWTVEAADVLSHAYAHQQDALAESGHQYLVALRVGCLSSRLSGGLRAAEVLRRAVSRL